MSELISLDQVTVFKEGRSIIDHLSLKIYNGKHIALTGVTGAGKSTLLDLIAGKTISGTGTITRPKDIKIALVPRDGSFNKIVQESYQYYQQRYQSVDSEIGPSVVEIFRDQVMPLGTIDHKSVELHDSKYNDLQILDVAKTMHIDHLLDRKMPTLSNGETRRVWIALTLISQPDVLLLDNPFAGLDKESRALLKSILESLKHRLTMILVAHHRDYPDCIDQEIELLDGKIKSVNTRPFPRTPSHAHQQINLPDFLHADESIRYSIIASLNQVSILYGSKPALDNISLTIRSGSRWCIIGPNGSGKTTLLSLLTADHPQAYNNDIVLFDRPRGSGESIWDIKSKIGFVSPELQLYFERDQSIWKIVASGLFDTIGLFRKVNEDQIKQVDQMLNYIGVIHLRERLWYTLSMGEQRLVLLARALIKNPTLLILDEACQNLDDHFTEYFLSLIDSIMAGTQKTLLYVSHIPTEIPQCIDHTLYLKDGKILKID